MIINTRLIEEEIFKGTAVEASKKLGISVRTINSYRAKETVQGYRNWKSLSIEKAEQIMQIIINEKEKKTMDAYNQLKRFIEEDIAEKEFGHGEIEDFDPKRILRGEIVETSSTDLGAKHSKVKVVISLADLELDNVLDQYVADFDSKEVNVYYV